MLFSIIFKADQSKIFAQNAKKKKKKKKKIVLFSFIFKADESKVLAENIEVERQKFEASSKEITKLQEAVRKAEAKSVF